MILVVDPESEVRNAIHRALRWADKRYNILAVESLSEASAVVKKRRLTMIVCHPGLPQLEEFLTATSDGRRPPFVALCSQTEPGGTLAPLIDTVVPRPPAPIMMMSCIRLMKAKLKNGVPAEFRGNGRTRRSSRQGGNGNGTIHITVLTVSCAGEVLQPLKFRVPAAGNIQLKGFLRQLGKQEVRWFRLDRNREEVRADPATGLQDGDELVLGCVGLSPVDRSVLRLSPLPADG